jgi:hypothetical protein
LEINHPFEEPEDEPAACKRLYQIPNFVNDDPRNYINLNGMSGIGGDRNQYTNTIFTSKHHNPEYSSQFTDSKMDPTNSIDMNHKHTPLTSGRKERVLAKSDDGVIEELKNERTRSDEEIENALKK